MKLGNFAGGWAAAYSEGEADKRAWMQERVAANRKYLLDTGLPKFQEIKDAKDARKANIATAVKMGFTKQAAQALELQGGLEMQLAKLRAIGKHTDKTINREALQKASELIWKTIPDEEGRRQILDYFTDSEIPNNANDLQEKFIMAITNAKRNDADFIAAREILASIRAKERPEVNVTVPGIQNYQEYGLKKEREGRLYLGTLLGGFAGVTFPTDSNEEFGFGGLTGKHSQDANITMDHLMAGYKDSYNRNEDSMAWLMMEARKLKKFLSDSGISETNKWEEWNKRYGQ
tara:strand:+ start:1827 stop:2696 length:870 start_codon:yes stop_codon:yes gene_type:complete